MGERAGDGSFKGPWGDKLKTDSFRSHSCGYGDTPLESQDVGDQGRRIVRPSLQKK